MRWWMSVRRAGGTCLRLICVCIQTRQMRQAGTESVGAGGRRRRVGERRRRALENVDEGRCCWSSALVQVPDQPRPSALIWGGGGGWPARHGTSSDGPASSLRMFGHVHRAMCGGGCQFEVLEEYVGARMGVGGASESVGGASERVGGRLRSSEGAGGRRRMLARGDVAGHQP